MRTSEAVPLGYCCCAKVVTSIRPKLASLLMDCAGPSYITGMVVCLYNKGTNASYFLAVASCINDGSHQLTPYPNQATD